MTLTFRGQEYEATPAEIIPVRPELTGQYRGIATRLSTNLPTASAPLNLRYRGIAYRR